MPPSGLHVAGAEAFSSLGLVLTVASPAAAALLLANLRRAERGAT